MILSSCHHYSLNNDCHCHCHYMRRIYLFYGLTWFKLLITSLTWQEHILSGAYLVFPLLIKVYIIHYTLVSCILPLFIKCYYLLSFFLTLNILISTSATSSSLRYYYYCLCHYLLNNHAIFFFFFLLNFVYYIASISFCPANMGAYLTVINLWLFH